MVTIASSSLRDGGVRAKLVWLTEGHWIIVDVPQWNVKHSLDFFYDTIGQPYDWRGALATVLPGHNKEDAWFCNEWVAYPYLKSAANFGPHQLQAICLSIGRNVTDAFFKDREKLK